MERVMALSHPSHAKRAALGDTKRTRGSFPWQRLNWRLPYHPELTMHRLAWSSQQNCGDQSCNAGSGKAGPGARSSDSYREALCALWRPRSFAMLETFAITARAGHGRRARGLGGPRSAIGGDRVGDWASQARDWAGTESGIGRRDRRCLAVRVVDGPGPMPARRGPPQLMSHSLVPRVLVRSAVS
jgi:hypothetical protein